MGVYGPRIFQVVRLDEPWTSVFAILPHKTVSGEWKWFQRIYRRKVWLTAIKYNYRYEYGTIFDVLAGYEAQV